MVLADRRAADGATESTKKRRRHEVAAGGSRVAMDFASGARRYRAFFSASVDGR